MRLLRQVIEVAMVARSMGGSSISVHMMSKLMRLLVLSLVAGLLGCLLMLAVLYLVYRGAGAYGLDSDGALLVTGMVVLSALFCVLACISHTLGKIRNGVTSPVSRIRDVADAFIDGLTRPTQPRQ